MIWRDVAAVSWTSHVARLWTVEFNLDQLDADSNALLSTQAIRAVPRHSQHSLTPLSEAVERNVVQSGECKWQYSA